MVTPEAQHMRVAFIRMNDAVVREAAIARTMIAFMFRVDAT